MKIEVRLRDIDALEALRAHAVRRVCFQLSRFGDKLGPVVVRVSDVNGPKGGADKRCLISMRIRGGSTLAVNELSADAYSAIDLAVGRAARVLGRELERARSVRRDVALGDAS